MSYKIGDLVRINKGKGKGEVGIILDYQHVGRFYPSTHLTIKLASGETIKSKEVSYVDKLGENND